MFNATSDIRIDEVDLIRSITKQSFYEFVKEFWGTVVSDSYVNNWHIKYLCDEIQIVVERVIAKQKCLYDLIINISPGTTKSTIVTIMLPAWLWSRMPSASIIGVSFGSNHAIDLSRKNRMVVKSELYRECFPEVVINPEQDAKGQFTTTAGGERHSVGVDGDIVGRHADLILIDDPLNPEAAKSDADRRKANNFINETLSKRKRDKDIAATILIMQRLHQDDPTAMLLNLHQCGGIRVKHICIPAEISDKINPPELVKYYKNGLMDEKRLGKEKLKEESLRGAYSYSGQYMQWPIPLGGGMFKIDKINVMDLPQDVRFVSICRYWDKAGTKENKQNKEPCYTAGVKIGKDTHNRFWILHAIRGRWEAAEREQIIKNIAIADKAAHGLLIKTKIEQEGGSGGKESADNTIKNLAGLRVSKDRPTGDKALRADPFAAQVNVGNVYMVPAVWNNDYLSEMEFFPNSTFKDQMDASSGAFNDINGKMVVGGVAWATARRTG